MNIKDVLNYFESEVVVDHYFKATINIGLWESEKKIFNKIFKFSDSIIELGCGVGRISLGLYEMGYQNILATDYSRNMIKKANKLSRSLGSGVAFRKSNVLDLEFEDKVFDGAIFGFNGLMQIPKSKNREKALTEIYRVLKKDSFFVFTSHLRNTNKTEGFWEKERIIWDQNNQNKELDDFGDKLYRTDMGYLYIHIPSEQEMKSLLTKIGFNIEALVPRRVISNENHLVREFSDDCFFWVLRK